MLKITLSSKFHDQREIFAEGFSGFQSYLSCADDIDAKDYRAFLEAFTTGVMARDHYTVVVEEVKVWR